MNCLIVCWLVLFLIKCFVYGMNWCYYFIDLQQKAIFSKNWVVLKRTGFFWVFFGFFIFFGGFFQSLFWFQGLWSSLLLSSLSIFLPPPLLLFLWWYFALSLVF